MAQEEASIPAGAEEKASRCLYLPALWRRVAAWLTSSSQSSQPDAGAVTGKDCAGKSAAKVIGGLPVTRLRATGIDGLRPGLCLARGRLGGGGRLAEKISNGAAVDGAFYDDGKNLAQRSGKIRVQLRMFQHGSADDDFTARIDFALGAPL